MNRRSQLKACAVVGLALMQLFQGLTAVVAQRLDQSLLHDGLRFAPIYDPDRKWGFVDKTGRMVIAPQYMTVSDFNEERCVVRSDERTNQFGVIDTKGKVIVAEIYESINQYSEGLAAALKGGRWGFIDRHGKVVIPLKYTEVTDFSEGTAGVEIGKRFALVDKTGKEIARMPVLASFKEGLSVAIVKTAGNEMFGYIDRSGRFVIKPKFEQCGDFRNGRAWARLNGQPVRIDKSGKVLYALTTDSWQTVGLEAPFMLEPARENAKFNYIEDEKGKTLFSVVEGSKFREGVARVMKLGKTAYVDKTGKNIFPSHYFEGGDFSEGFARVKECGLTGYINKKGQFVIKPQYLDGYEFHEGLAAIAVPRDKKERTRYGLQRL